MKRKVDKTKSVNIKCKNCANWRSNDYQCYCILTASKTNYWNRCKRFEWAAGIEYTEDE